MRVLHFKPTMRAEEGGVVKAVFDLCHLTSSPNIRVGLATYHTRLVRETLPEHNRDDIELHPIDLPRASTRLLSRRDLRRLRPVIAGYDLLHLHTLWTPSNIQVVRICRDLNIPYVLTVHGMLDAWCMRQRRLKKQLYLRTWARRLLPDAARIHATSTAEKEQIDQRSRAAPSVMLHLPVGVEEFRSLPGPGPALARFPQIRPDVPILLFLSRVHPKKGLERLIRASALLRAGGVEHQLVVAGTGDAAYTQSLKALTAREGVESTTHFVGFVAGVEKVSLYQSSAAFALPTSQENFGFVFFEALASGTPVVTTRGVDTWEELVGSGGGVVAENTPRAFADALAPLLADPDRAARMGAAGRAWSLRHFDHAGTISDYEALYRACLERTP